MSILDLYMGAEELELDTAEVTEAVEEVVKTEIAEVATAIEEQSNQIEELTEEIQELEEASEEVVEIVEGLESLLASGNFHADSFAYQYNRAAKLNARLGGRNGSRLGAESLGDASTAQLMARDGIEGFMDTVKDWGKKAADFIKHIFNTVIGFFTSLFDQSAKLEKRAKALGEKLKAGEVVENVKLGSWNSYIDYKDKAGKVKLSELSLPSAQISAVITAVSKEVKTDNTNAFKSAFGKLASWIEKDAGVFGLRKSNETEDGKRLIGQVAAIRMLAEVGDQSKITDAASGAKVARATKLAFKVDSEKAKSINTGETPAKVKANGLESILKEVTAFAGEMRRSKVKNDFSAAERDRTVGMLMAIKTSDTDEAEAKIIDGNVKLVRGVYSMAAGMTQASFKFMTSFNKARLDMVAAHIK